MVDRGVLLVVAEPRGFPPWCGEVEAPSLRERDEGLAFWLVASFPVPEGVVEIHVPDQEVVAYWGVLRCELAERRLPFRCNILGVYMNG